MGNGTVIRLVQEGAILVLAWQIQAGIPFTILQVPARYAGKVIYQSENGTNRFRNRSFN